VQAGWTGVQNGELLRRAAEGGFEVLVTMDRNLEHQQNIARAGVGVLVIVARDSRVETVLPLARSINTALSGLHPGMVVQSAPNKRMQADGRCFSKET